MNTTQSIITLLAVLGGTLSTSGQISTATNGPKGLLGQSYTDASFAVHDIDRLRTNSYDFGASANRPIHPNVDLGGSYGYAWMRGDFRSHANALGLSLTGHGRVGEVRPFLGAAMGYQWTHGPAGVKDDFGLWAVAAGAEYVVGDFSATPRIVYADDFRRSRDSSQQITYELEGNWWVSGRTGFFLCGGYTEVERSPFDAWSFRAGARFKF